MLGYALDLFFDRPDIFENSFLRHPTQSAMWEQYITGLVPPSNFSRPMTEMTDEMCARELVAFTERWGILGFRRVIDERKKDTIVPLPLFLDHDMSDHKKAQLAALYKSNWGQAGERLLRYYAIIMEIRIAHEHK